MVQILPYMEVKSPYMEIYGIVFGRLPSLGVEEGKPTIQIKETNFKLQNIFLRLCFALDDE